MPFMPTTALLSDAPSYLQRAAFSMSAQEIKDSTLTPHEIIPAQGAGTLTVPTMFVLRFAAGAIPFTSGDLEFVYGDMNLNSLTGNVLAGPDDARWVFGSRTSELLFLGVSEGGPPADFLNKPIRLRAALRGSIAVATDTGSDPGTDYAPGDTGTVDDGSPNATYVIDTVGLGGSVLTFTITDGGDGYNLGAGGAESEWTTTPGGAQPGIGTGFTVLVEAVDASASAGDGTLHGAIYYLVEGV